MKTKHLIIGVLALFMVQTTFAQDSLSVYDISLEELMNMQVTSVSKKAEKLQNVPSAIYVISSHDIEKSGATNIAELLRESVPGYWAATLDYKRNDSYIRNTNSGSMLILLDGTPMQDLMSSTFAYNNFDIPLADIDRIEVIKGSGGTVYGANSASGVISIFTKNADGGDKISVGLKGATPTYGNVNVSLSKKINNKLSVHSYAQYNYFGGYKQLDNIKNNQSKVQNTATGADTTITSRFTGDDQTTQFMSFGISPKFEVNSKLTISANLHANTSILNNYSQSSPIEKSIMTFDANYMPGVFAGDTVILNDDSKTRIVGNIKADYKISDNNNLFFRLSTNYENQKQFIGGGFDTKNRIIDFEIQDNFEIAFNTFSLGANYRLINYNLTNFYDPTSIGYIDPQNDEGIKGAFIQDKLSFLDNKLNFYIGIKAENFSLLNDKFYLSPMAKVVINPIDKLTIWGGYTQSYTTPGYNQTNVQFNIFRAKTSDFYYPVIYSGVYQYVTTSTISELKTNYGLDDATAAAQASAFLQSPAGVDTINKYVNFQLANYELLYPNKYSVSAINGPSTEPTSLGNIEIGIRYQPTEKIYLESNFFTTTFKDGIINSPTKVEHIKSRTVPGEYIDAYYYGNYLKGTNTGLESLVKIFATKDLTIELSHAWFTYNVEFQKNNDFDITILSDYDRDVTDEKFPTLPQHILRGKVTYDFPMDIRVNLSGLYTSTFFNKFGKLTSPFEGDLQRFDPLYSDNLRPFKNSNIYGENDSRTIVNFRIDKFFLDKKLDVYLFGNDITSSPFVESINQLTIAYPRQVSSMFGAGVNYNF